MDIIKLLDQRAQADLTLGPGGARAMHRPDVAPLAYEVRLIASAYGNINKSLLPDFLGGANQEFFETLYQQCNGIHIGATKFHVYGFLIGDQSVGVPWNIEIPNDLTSETRPKKTLIVGTSTERSATGIRQECCHTIQSTHELVVSPQDSFSTALRRYDSVGSWLKFEFARALNDRDSW